VEPGQPLVDPGPQRLEEGGTRGADIARSGV
jgi:hypothetical protein